MATCYHKVNFDPGFETAYIARTWCSYLLLKLTGKEAKNRHWQLYSTCLFYIQHNLPGHSEIYRHLGPYGPGCSYATAVNKGVHISLSRLLISSTAVGPPIKSLIQDSWSHLSLLWSALAGQHYSHSLHSQWASDESNLVCPCDFRFDHPDYLLSITDWHSHYRHYSNRTVENWIMYNQQEAESLTIIDLLSPECSTRKPSKKQTFVIVLGEI